jgi:DNA sulfur modification protein DndB
MKVKFPAMQATIGQRIYYACVMKLSAIPKMFTFTDWIEFTAEDREQRVLNKKRIPDIARYILDNEDGYLFSSITASYKCQVRFEAVNSDGLGFLEMDLEEANFVINDGQHRCAAIAQAIKENPALREESISVLLFPYESKQRVQQMFSDLNRYVVKTAKSLDILFDQRDLLAKVTLEVCESVPAFQGMVDRDNVSLPARSEKMFTLSSLYDANQELLAEKRNGDDAFFNELVTTGVDYWTTVSRFMPDWQRVKNGLRPIELRQENISTHSVVLRALGGLGAEVMKQFPTDWKNRLADLTAVNWSKKNREWENVCMVANSVVSNRQARLATKAYLKRKLALSLTEAEEKSIAHLAARNEVVPNRPDQEIPVFNGSRKEAKKIRIEIHWSSDNKEIICEPKASESFVRFVTRLYEIKGVDVLAKLSTCKFSRGILLSKTPRLDFSYTRNDGRQTEYSNQPIANSGYYLLTHGETWQKTADIAEICRVLGLPTGTVKVEEIEKNDLFKEFTV